MVVTTHERLLPIIERAMTRATSERDQGEQRARMWMQQLMRHFDGDLLTQDERNTIYAELVRAARELGCVSARDQLELIAIAEDIQEGRAIL